MTHVPKVCATCTRILDYIEHSDGSTGYAHASQIFKGNEDHVPIPIDPTEENVSSMCDFCYMALGEDQWTVVTRPFLFSATQGGHSVHLNMSALWAACPMCKVLIENKKWMSLLERAFSAAEKYAPSVSSAERTVRREGLNALYKEVMAHYVTVRRPRRGEVLDDRHFAPNPFRKEEES